VQEPVIDTASVVCVFAWQNSNILALTHFPRAYRANEKLISQHRTYSIIRNTGLFGYGFMYIGFIYKVVPTVTCGSSVTSAVSRSGWGFCCACSLLRDVYFRNYLSQLLREALAIFHSRHGLKNMACKAFRGTLNHWRQKFALSASYKLRGQLNRRQT
jgi:hypothetical protein